MPGEEIVPNWRREKSHRSLLLPLYWELPDLGPCWESSYFPKFRIYWSRLGVLGSIHDDRQFIKSRLGE